MTNPLETSNTSTAWLQTYTGRAVYPLAFTRYMICIEDIAWSLSHQCRFAGHSNRFYSVAEHSLHIASVVPPRLKLQALLHDASETYLIDVPRPIKFALIGYKEIEENIQRAIASWAGFDYEDFEEIKPYDSAILSDEQKVLMPSPPKQWDTHSEGLYLTTAIKNGLGSPEDIYRIFRNALACGYPWNGLVL